jgi:hypothetical protein
VRDDLLRPADRLAHHRLELTPAEMTEERANVVAPVDQAQWARDL